MMKSLREFTQEVINQCHRACLIVQNQCCPMFPSVLLVGGFLLVEWEPIRLTFWLFDLLCNMMSRTVPMAASFGASVFQLELQILTSRWQSERHLQFSGFCLCFCQKFLEWCLFYVLAHALFEEKKELFEMFSCEIRLKASWFCFRMKMMW